MIRTKIKNKENDIIFRHPDMVSINDDHHKIQSGNRFFECEPIDPKMYGGPLIESGNMMFFRVDSVEETEGGCLIQVCDKFHLVTETLEDVDDQWTRSEF